MIPSAAPDDDPLEQDAVEQDASDPAVEKWFLGDAERRNPATDLRVYSTGNQVVPLVDGAGYFQRLCEELGSTRAGDQVYFLDFRGDMDERLDGGPAARSAASWQRPPTAVSASSACCGGRTRSGSSRARRPTPSSSAISATTAAR